MDSSLSLRQENFTTREAAECLAPKGTAYTAGTLEVYRSRGIGPRFKRVGHGRGRTYYERAALDEFVNGTAVHTADSWPTS